MFINSARLRSVILVPWTENIIPVCPRCGEQMRLAFTMPRLSGLPDLRTYDCKQCGVALTEAYEPTQNAGSLT
jgi:hypothetical protein